MKATGTGRPDVSRTEHHVGETIVGMIVQAALVHLQGTTVPFSPENDTVERGQERLTGS